MELVASFLLVSGMTIIFLIIVLLIKSKKRELPQHLLIVYFSFLLLILIHAYGQLHGVKLFYIVGFLFDSGARYFLAPLLYIYVKSLICKEDDFVVKNLKHFIPFGISTVFLSIPFLLSIIKGQYVLDYLDFFNRAEYFALIEGFYFVFYIIISLKIFRQGRKAMEENYSNFNENDFEWVRKMLLSALVVMIIDITTGFYEYAFGKLSWDIGYVTILSLIPLVTYMGYYGIQQSKVLLPGFLRDKQLGKKSKEEKLNLLSAVSEEQQKQWKDKLQKLMIQQEPYLDEELSLGKLAKLVDLHEKKLSALLNHGLNTSFYDFVNNYRVEAVMKKLGEPESANFTILGIAYDCGFKSKSSFNRIFKKKTGYLPSEYKKKVNGDLRSRFNLKRADT